MLSIHNVTSGQAFTYYTQDSYYTRDQLGGQWAGRGAELLGLDGDFSREDFENIVKGVTEKVRTGNLVAALFQHDTSRELNPQLHTHAVVMNMTLREDGKWRALASDKTHGDVLYGSKMFVGQIYRSELAGKLKELGYDVISDSRGLFEVKGMDKTVLDEFSSRKEQIDDKVRVLKESGLYKGVNDQKLREIAALGSRVAKKDVDMDMVRSSWQERLSGLGYTRDSLITDLHRPDKGSFKETPSDTLRMTVQALTDNEAVFTRRQVIENSLRLSVGHGA